MCVFKTKPEFLLAQFQYQEDLLLFLLLEKVIVIANGRKGPQQRFCGLGPPHRFSGLSIEEFSLAELVTLATSSFSNPNLHSSDLAALILLPSPA